MSTVNDLTHEVCRLMTFNDDWPHSFISPRILAKIGFYFIGPHDRVKCYFCKVEVSSWEMGDNEVNEHLRWSPRCPLMKRCESTNVPIKPISQLDELLPPPLVSFDVCGTSGIDRRPGSYAETLFSPPSGAAQYMRVLGSLVTMGAEADTATEDCEMPSLRRCLEFPEYGIELARLRSFDEWPRSMKQKPEQLSDAGFFYTEKSDRVICFSCGGGLRDWDEKDDPWEQHALWYEKCDYLRLIKGPEYIAAIKKKFGNIRNEKENDIGIESSSSSLPQEDTCESNNTNSISSCSSSSLATLTPDNHNRTDENKLNESRLCKICCASEYNTVFLPCGHVVACAKCASSQIRCPLCRKPFDSVMRIFLS